MLLENRDQILLSKRLFTIVDDIPMDVDWNAVRTVLPTGDVVRHRLGDLGLRHVLSQIDRLAKRTGAASAGADDHEADVEAADRWDGEARGYRLIQEPAELEAWLGSLPPGAPLAVDTETDSLRPDRARLVGVSLCAAPGKAVYVPLLTRTGEAQGSLFAGEGECDGLADFRSVLGPVLSDPVRLKVGQNLKYDTWILDRHGLPLAGPSFDTMLAAYVLDPGRLRFGLDDLARDLLDHQTIPYGDLYETGDKVRDILSVPLDRLAVYAAEDADIALRLREVFVAELTAEPELARLFHEVETPLSHVLFRMERNGIAVDIAFLDELHGRFAAQMEQLETRSHAAAGREFNVQSPKQLAEVLFDELGLKPTKKIATGWSTDVSVLEGLAGEHPLIPLILEHRQLAKLQGTYVESLKSLVNENSGLVHTSFNQAVAATGRLSSSDPNLQNIPIRTENGRLIRRAFVPRAEGRVFLSADYSQVELRLLAHLSGDEGLITTFRDGGDVHRRTAALIAGVASDDVTPEMRSNAKAINFGVIYGMGARALARQISVSVREASAFIDSYFRTYPGVKAFIEQSRATARKTGAATTLLGRRRPLPDILSENNRLRSFSERIAVNTPIQGTAADLIKVAMIRVDAELRSKNLESLLLLQVHDELLLEVPLRELDVVRTLVREAMEGVADLAVPLTVDIHTGVDWAAAHG